MGVVDSRGTVRDRLLSRIRRDPSGCWLWTAAHNGFYGKIYAWGRLRSAHRVSYRVFKGEIPHGADVRHRCDTPLCVNPDHLETGTRLDNMRDACERGRMAIGERTGAARLTAEAVIAIRREYPRTERRIAELCREYGVTRRSIFRARSGETWRHLPPVDEIAHLSGDSSSAKPKNGATTERAG